MYAIYKIMEVLEKKMNAKEFWETCNLNYAHLKDTIKVIKKGNNNEQRFKNEFLDHVDFKNKIVMDYGCGGGFLGKYLIEEKGIKKYIAVDIANRSLLTAKKNLKNYLTKCDFILSDEAEFKADIFISLACIQHFESREYFDKFIKKLNDSKIPVLILQYRYNEKTIFNGAYLADEFDAGLACRLNNKTLIENLKSYKLKRESKLENNKYNYTVWMLKK